MRRSGLPSESIARKIQSAAAERGAQSRCTRRNADRHPRQLLLKQAEGSGNRFVVGKRRPNLRRQWHQLYERHEHDRHAEGDPQRTGFREGRSTRRQSDASSSGMATSWAIASDMKPTRVPPPRSRQQTNTTAKRGKNTLLSTNRPCGSGQADPTGAPQGLADLSPPPLRRRIAATPPPMTTAPIANVVPLGPEVAWLPSCAKHGDCEETV